MTDAAGVPRLEELHALGKRFVSSHHKGMKRLAQFWELDAEETRKACSWCPTAGVPRDAQPLEFAL